MPTTAAMLTLFAGLLAADAPLDVGTQLVYRGSVALLEETGETAPPEKRFDLTFLVAERHADGVDVCWWLQESGRGEWIWAERFGRARVDWDGQSSASGPSLWYDHGETSNVLGIPFPWVEAGVELAPGATWNDAGGLTYNVMEPARLDGRETFRVQVNDNYGRKRLVWLAPDNPVCVALAERVFMLMGTEFELSMHLISSEQLPAEAAQREIARCNALVALREALERPARSESTAWTDEQLALLEEKLPELLVQIDSGPLQRIAQAAERDWQLQSGRADDVARLIAAHEGRKVEAFRLEGSSCETLTEADLDGQVTVLHFWDYRDEPLQEPYGQVGYLDFLYGQRKAAGLKLYGVAVDGRLADETTRGAAIRGVRKLKSFMNLSYPVLLDEGILIKQFGDPRVVGAALPLFVVIGADGRVIHYHVGHYDVDRDRGLEELDRRIVDALRNRS